MASESSDLVKLANVSPDGKTLSLDEACHLVLRIGRLLLENGADTELAKTRVEALTAALGFEAQVFISSERVLLTVLSGRTFRTKVGAPIHAPGVNLGRLDALDTVARDIEQKRIDVAEAGRRIDALEKSPLLHPVWLVIPAVALTTACLARLFGAEWPVVAAAFFAGIVSMALRLAFGRRGVNPVAAAFATAFISALAGVLLMKAIPEAAPTLCLVAAGMILVPGVPLINSVSDMMNGHVVAGLARLATGSVTIIAIGFGLFLAAAAAGDVLPVSQDPDLLPIAEDFLFAGLAAFGYAMLFNVPMRSAWACVICGMASHGVRTALVTFGMDVAVATLPCAILAGGLARWFSVRLGAPWSTFAFPGVVAMIPGSYAFRAGVGALQIMREGANSSSALIAETLSLIISTGILTAAVGIGLVIVSAVPLRMGEKARNMR